MSDKLIPESENPIGQSSQENMLTRISTVLGVGGCGQEERGCGQEGRGRRGHGGRSS